MRIPSLRFDRTIVMRRPQLPDADAGRFTVAELAGEEAIMADCAAVQRGTSLERVRQRSARGLRFFSLREQGRVVANTWLAAGGERFLDEAMLVFELAPDDACLRDVFVNPADRGRGLFARLVATLAAGPLHGRRALWSCVERSNAASIAAHRRAGFVPAGSVLAVDAFGVLLWRRARLPRDLHCREYARSRSLLWMDAGARRFRLDRMA
jgi:GNAT superfamily N-acetyltransferase